jgi:hypothetical protein
MEEALRAHLLANAAVNTACGGRMYWSVRPQGSAYPSGVLTIISRIPERLFSGPAGLAAARVQVDCYADTYSQAKALYRAVKAVLNNLTFTNSGKRFWGFAENERDLTDAGATDAARIHRVSADFLIWHED